MRYGRKAKTKLGNGSIATGTWIPSMALVSDAAARSQAPPIHQDDGHNLLYAT